MMMVMPLVQAIGAEYSLTRRRLCDLTRAAVTHYKDDQNLHGPYIYRVIVP